MKFLRIENEGENLEEAQIVFSFTLSLDENGVRSGKGEIILYVSLPLIDNNQRPEDSNTPISELISKAKIRAEKELGKYLKTS